MLNWWRKNKKFMYKIYKLLLLKFGIEDSSSGWLKLEYLEW